MHSTPALPHNMTVVQAPTSWQRVDFISDVHLDANAPATFEAWQNYMANTPADAVFILGDLFEVWVGDDTTDAFALSCADVLERTSQRLPVYFLCGNRDFLVGQQLHNATGMHGMSDPTVLKLGQQCLLLTHGDSLCLDDVDYLQFRQQVRQVSWQEAFLAKPLSERQHIARGLRAQSEARKQTTTDYADVDAQAATDWLRQTQCQTLIHGHTHKPATHDLGSGLTRWCLSDWHADGPSPRLEVLSWLRNQDNSPTQGLCRSSLL
jgi:UDP-2,3-diacylglucosamine hydrolase